VEAPAVGSVLLASILLKVSVYGLLRFVIPLVNEAIVFFFSFFSIFCLLSIIIAAFLAIIQTDIKKIIAYSSISHMNYIVLGLLSNDVSSIVGSIYYMVAHAFISAGLFFLIGSIYDQYGSRELLNFNSVNFYNPTITFFFFIFNSANLAFPLTSSFIAELIILANLSKISSVLVLFMIFPLFFSLIYML
jgi:NADH-quinone oxidoreductase subunit M